MSGLIWYLPNIPVVNSKSGRIYIWAYKMLLIVEAYGTDFIWSFCHWIWGYWWFPNLSPLTIGAGVALHWCILYFFSTFLCMTSMRVLILHYVYLLWNSILKHKRLLLCLFISKFEERKLSVSASRSLSLLAKNMSSTYRTKKIYFLSP